MSRVLTKKDALDNLQEVLEYYESELISIEKSLTRDGNILRDIKDHEFKGELAGFMEKMADALSSKLETQSDKFKRYDAKIPMVHTLMGFVEDFDFALDIYRANFEIEENGAQVIKELREFTREEFIQNLEELEIYRKSKLEEVKTIVNENEIMLKSLKNKTWGQEERVLVKRMVDRLSLMNKQQKPEIKANKKVLKSVKNLKKLIQKEELATIILNTILFVYGG